MIKQNIYRIIYKKNVYRIVAFSEYDAIVKLGYELDEKITQKYKIKLMVGGVLV